MITVRVQGGLGNQMFIYAAGRSWALANNTELALDTINGGYGAREKFGRSYSLGSFKIAAKSADPDIVAKHRPSTRGYYWRRKINLLLPLSLRSLILEPRHYNPQLPYAQLKKDAYLAGYWQREEYFSRYAREIRQELQLRNPLRPEIQSLADLLGEDSSVFVHIRRQEYGYKLTPKYYQNAIALVRSSVPTAKFFVFGDDALWARRHLKLPSDACYMDSHATRSDSEDLWRMTKCRHAIIANSSFSWWGAWLRDNQDGIVVSPLHFGYNIVPCTSNHQMPAYLAKDCRFI